MLEKETAQRPPISVVIPVLGEGRGLNRVLAALFAAARGAEFEVLVVDGDPSGSTIRHAQRPGVRTLTAPAGRGAQMNAGAREARGGILLFLHADTLLPDGWPALVRGALANGLADWGAFDLDFAPSSPLLRLAARVASLRSRLERLPYGDQALFARASAFRALGGYAEIPIMEDVELLRRVRRSGGQVLILPRRVRTSPRRYEAEGFWSRVFKNWSLRLGFALGVDPRDLARWYRPHGPARKEET